MLTLSQEFQVKKKSRPAPPTESPEKGREIAKTEARTRNAIRKREARKLLVSRG